jgi:peroxiredoxin
MPFFTACGDPHPVASDPFAPVAARVVSAVSPEGSLAETKRILDSVVIASPDSLRPVVQAICRALVDAGRKTEAIHVAALVYGIEVSGQEQISLRLLTSILLPGTKAPEIDGLVPSAKQHTFTVVLFHESTCRTCQDMIWELKEQYQELQKSGVRIVTISTDTDPKTWDEYAATLPWPDKLCDYKGFHTPDMDTYGVASTPTMFLVNDKGVVVDQYGTVKEILKVLKNNEISRTAYH